MLPFDITYLVQLKVFLNQVFVQSNGENIFHVYTALATVAKLKGWIGYMKEVSWDISWRSIECRRYMILSRRGSFFIFCFLSSFLLLHFFLNNVISPQSYGSWDISCCTCIHLHGLLDHVTPCFSRSLVMCTCFRHYPRTCLPNCVFYK